MKSSQGRQMVFLFLLGAFISFTVAQLDSQAAVFVKIDGIDGESTDANHADWIDVLSWSWGMTNDPSPSGQLTLGDMVLVKEFDKSTPKLHQSLCSGAMIPAVTVTIEFVSSNNPGEAKFMEYKLKNVLITSIRPGGVSKAGTAEDIPLEEITLNYTEIEWTYTKLDSTGLVVEQVSGSCSKPTGKQ